MTDRAPTATAAVLHLRSLGQLTSDVRRPYATLARAVEALRIRPAVTIDGVPYFDVQAVVRITAAATAQCPAPPPDVRPRRENPRCPANRPAPRSTPSRAKRG